MSTISIGRAIAEAADRDPDALAVTCGAESITRGELERQSNQMARAYAEMGVTEGRFVTIALPNSVEWFVAAIATWKLGATPQPVSYRLPDRERQAIVDLADPAIVLGADPASHPGRTVLATGWRPDPSTDDGALPDVITAAWKAPTSGGSTGRPKLIVAGDAGVVTPGQPGMGQRTDGAICMPGPLYHNAPFSFASQAVFHGNHTVVLPSFDAEATLAAVQDHRCDWLYLVPTMMQRIWRLPAEVRERYDLSALQVCWHMAAPCPPWLKEAFIHWLGGERVFELYAGTEAQSVTVIRGDEWLAHRGSVGRPIAGEMQIRDPETYEVLPPGEVGEVFMRSNRGATYTYIGADARVSPDGWESLGDMGSMDADGYLFLTDRRSDMILSGGSNIYPAEVEAAIDEHPAVMSCAVIGLPDDDLGSRIHAVVQTTSAVTDDELRAFLADRLVRYKIPRSFEYVDQPVRDEAGKVRRSALRDDRT